MVFQDVFFQLKDGRNAVIRCAKSSDAKGLVDYIKTAVTETDFLMTSPSESDKFSVDKEVKWIEDMNQSLHELMLVCVVEDKVVGNCQVSFGSALKNHHRGTIGIGLLKEYWNLGIGTKMFETMIRAAEMRGNVLQLELDFIEGNTRARALYEKMGFRITGVKPDAIQLEDGKLYNEYMMVRKIK